MNRRGSLELSTETIIKLLIFFALLVAVVYLVASIISLFTQGRDSFSAKRNFDILGERIDTMLAAGEVKTDTVIQLPIEYYIAAFEKDAKEGTITITFADNKEAMVKSIAINKPGTCGSAACLCLLKQKLSQTSDIKNNFEAINCKEEKVNFVVNFKQVSASGSAYRAPKELLIINQESRIVITDTADVTPVT